MEEIEIMHAETRIEMFGNPEDGWYTYKDQADDPMFDKCGKVPSRNPVFIKLNIPAYVRLTGFYQIKYSFGATLYSPHQNDSFEKMESKLIRREEKES